MNFLENDLIYVGSENFTQKENFDILRQSQFLGKQILETKNANMKKQKEKSLIEELRKYFPEAEESQL